MPCASPGGRKSKSIASSIIPDMSPCIMWTIDRVNVLGTNSIKLIYTYYSFKENFFYCNWTMCGANSSMRLGWKRLTSSAFSPSCSSLRTLFNLFPSFFPFSVTGLLLGVWGEPTRMQNYCNIFNAPNYATFYWININVIESAPT